MLEELKLSLHKREPGEEKNKFEHEKIIHKSFVVIAMSALFYSSS